MSLRSKMFVPFRVMDRYCTRCQRDTKQQTFVIRTALAIPLGVLTAGAFLVVWIL
jgi:hypothetical protein